jgi:hypothetical protein
VEVTEYQPNAIKRLEIPIVLMRGLSDQLANLILISNFLWLKLEEGRPVERRKSKRRIVNAKLLRTALW